MCIYIVVVHVCSSVDEYSCERNEYHPTQPLTNHSQHRQQYIVEYKSIRVCVFFFVGSRRYSQYVMCCVASIFGSQCQYSL